MEFCLFTPNATQSVMVPVVVISDVTVAVVVTLTVTVLICKDFEVVLGWSKELVLDTVELWEELVGLSAGSVVDVSEAVSIV